jgi:hypothetical protein
MNFSLQDQLLNDRPGHIFAPTKKSRRAQPNVRAAKKAAAIFSGPMATSFLIFHTLRWLKIPD